MNCPLHTGLPCPSWKALYTRSAQVRRFSPNGEVACHVWVEGQRESDGAASCLSFRTRCIARYTACHVCSFVCAVVCNAPVAQISLACHVSSFSRLVTRVFGLTGLPCLSYSHTTPSTLPCSALPKWLAMSLPCEAEQAFAHVAASVRAGLSRS